MHDTLHRSVVPHVWATSFPMNRAIVAAGTPNAAPRRRAVAGENHIKMGRRSIGVLRMAPRTRSRDVIGSVGQQPLQCLLPVRETSFPEPTELGPAQQDNAQQPGFGQAAEKNQRNRTHLCSRSTTRRPRQPRQQRRNGATASSSSFSSQTRGTPPAIPHRQRPRPAHHPDSQLTDVSALDNAHDPESSRFNRIAPRRPSRPQPQRNSRVRRGPRSRHRNRAAARCTRQRPNEWARCQIPPSSTLLSFLPDGAEAAAPERSRNRRRRGTHQKVAAAKQAAHV